MSKFCATCGNEVSENAKICMKCGCKVQNSVDKYRIFEEYIGFGVIGFLIPVAGVVLFFTFIKEARMAAIYAGAGAFIGILSLLLISCILLL